MVVLALLSTILLSVEQGPAGMHARDIDRVMRDRHAVIPLDTGRALTRHAMIDTAAIINRLIYPEKELKASRIGRVRVFFDVSTDGATRVLSVEPDGASYRFVEAAAAAVKPEVNGIPALRDGVAVRDTIVLTIDFIAMGHNGKGSFFLFVTPLRIEHEVSKERSDVMEMFAEKEPSEAELRELEKTEGPFPAIDEFLSIDQQPTYDDGELSRLIHYPGVALRDGIEGMVLLYVLVGRSGRVIRIVPDRESSGMFQHDAIEAVRKLRINPALVGGEPVAVWTQIPVVFRLAK